MNSPNQSIDPGKKTLSEFLLIDAEMALLFTQMAGNTSDSTLKVRRLKAAAKAYDRILAFIPRVPLTTEQMNELGQKLSVLRSRLRPRLATWAES